MQNNIILEKDAPVFNFKSDSGDKVSVSRNKMFIDLKKHYGSKDWWKELGFKNTSSIQDDDLTSLYTKAFSLKRIIRGKPLSQIVDGDPTKIKKYNSNFTNLTEVGKEIFKAMREDISNLLINYSFSTGTDWDHDGYTDKPIHRLTPVEFMRWLENIKIKMEKSMRVDKNTQIESLYNEIGGVWNDVEKYAIAIIKKKMQSVFDKADIPEDFAKKDLKKYAGLMAALNKIKKDYPTKYDKIKGDIESTTASRGLTWYVNNPKETLLSYIETFYKEEISDFFSLRGALKSSKEDTRSKTLKIAPNFNIDSYGGVVGKLYEDLLELAFKVKLGLISGEQFKSKFNKLASGGDFQSLINTVNLKSLFRFNSMSKKNSSKLDDLMNKENITRALMKMHCFNVVTIILNHFNISQNQIMLRMNMLQAISAYEKNLDWLKQYNKQSIDKLSDLEIEKHFYKIFDIDSKTIKGKNLAKFQNVGFKTKKWAPVDYLIGGKPISLKRQLDLKKIRIKSGASISGDSGNLGNEMRGMLRKNHKENPTREIKNEKLQQELLTLIKDVLFRNNHYLVVVTNKQVGVFDLSEILNIIDIDSFKELSNFGGSGDSDKLTLDNKLKIKFKTTKPVKITLYSLSTADNVLNKLRSGRAVKDGGVVTKGKFNAEIRRNIKGSGQLSNGVFMLKIDFRKGKESADLTFMLDGQAKLTDVAQLEHKKFLPDYEKWLNKEIIFTI